MLERVRILFGKESKMSDPELIEEFYRHMAESAGGVFEDWEIPPEKIQDQLETISESLRNGVIDDAQFRSLWKELEGMLPASLVISGACRNKVKDIALKK